MIANVFGTIVDGIVKLTGMSSGPDTSTRTSGGYPTEGRQSHPDASRKAESTINDQDRRERLRKVAERALRIMKTGHFTYRGETYSLEVALKESRKDTEFFPADSRTLSCWRERNIAWEIRRETQISILKISTVDAARLLDSSSRFLPEGTPAPKVGVLNFASATKPGGGFKNGAQAQEESIARVSTLFDSLETREAKKFYEIHASSSSPYYTHSIIYSPGIKVFQNDNCDPIPPYSIEVVSSAAVNAGEVMTHKAMRGTAAPKSTLIEREMYERMGRILYLFETKDIRSIVLGTFGTGVFKNDIGMVAGLWARLLVEENARFRYSFDRVIFAITGDSTFGEFHDSFESWRKPLARRSAWRPVE